jgi:polyphosphate:AMP phosphotransferase
MQFDRLADTPRVSKEEFTARAPGLRVDLLNAQYDLKSADFSVVLLIAGDDRVGMVEVVQLLHEWMDARHLDTHIFEAATTEEVERPWFWRYWNVLPPRGKVGVYVAGWPQNVIGEHAVGNLDQQGFERRIGHIRRFEQALVDDGTLLLKFWIHTPQAEMRERLRRAKKNPRENWQVEPLDWELHEIFGKVFNEVEHLVSETDTPRTPWHVVDGRDDRTRDLAVMTQILQGLQDRLAAPPPVPLANAAPPSGGIPDALGQVDLAQSMDEEEYDNRLEANQARLARLTRRARERKQASVLVFEGWDAAGKGGAIRRITQSMAVRDYRVLPIAAPTDEERARHYLWRFARNLPRAGHVLILDRSWYGRVLVERVEGFARPEEWQRAYDEIVDFERHLVEHGYLLQKFWLHIDQAEQLARFAARELTPYKKYKITDEDYRNRDRWDDYVAAVNEMVARTHTPEAPWHLVPFNDKRAGRIQVLDTVSDALKAKLGKD